MTDIQLRTIRLNARYTHRLSIPPDFIRAYGLQEGDQVLWIPQPDGKVLLDFIPHGKCPLIPHAAEAA